MPPHLCPEQPYSGITLLHASKRLTIRRASDWVRLMRLADLRRVNIESAQFSDRRFSGVRRNPASALTSGGRPGRGGVAEWLMAADCKSARESVHRFESYPHHHRIMLEPNHAGVAQW